MGIQPPPKNKPEITYRIVVFNIYKSSQLGLLDFMPFTDRFVNNCSSSCFGTVVLTCFAQTTVQLHEMNGGTSIENYSCILPHATTIPYSEHMKRTPLFPHFFLTPA